jgi:hypothetical protein
MVVKEAGQILYDEVSENVLFKIKKTGKTYMIGAKVFGRFIKKYGLEVKKP